MFIFNKFSGTPTMGKSSIIFPSKLVFFSSRYPAPVPPSCYKDNRISRIASGRISRIFEY